MHNLPEDELLRERRIMPMSIALLCSGLGHIQRGHEAFARDLFRLLSDAADITLFKGGGDPAAREKVIPHIPRNSPLLDHVHVLASPKWSEAARELERLRVEEQTFAYAALSPLIAGNYDIVHCLEGGVCNVVYANRHLFRRTPRVVFSNGGAIPARNLPSCDFVQEHTQHNLQYGARKKSFMIPHGVDVQRFHPNVTTDFRSRHGIPADAFVVISVGTVCYHHKRMDYVIREVACIPDAYLIIVGEENRDTPSIKSLGKQLMGGRIVFARVPHDELPKIYAAADVFVLGSLFETFGIVYIEALAMGLPVICTNHVNQRSIVKEGVFIDMGRPGELTAALRKTPRDVLAELGRRGRTIAEQYYDLRVLKRQYLERYQAIAETACSLPQYSLGIKLTANAKNLVRWSVGMIRGRAE